MTFGEKIGIVGTRRLSIDGKKTASREARVALGRRPAFHEGKLWRKTALGKAYVGLTLLQTFGSVAVGRNLGHARVVHRPKILPVRGVEYRRGGGFERLRFVVRFLTSNGSGSHGGRALFSVHLSGLVLDFLDGVDVERALLFGASLLKERKRREMDRLGGRLEFVLTA